MIHKYDYENDYKAFNDATIDFFYDDYFRGEEGHDYTDNDITMSTTKVDIDNCLELMRDTLYRHFGIEDKPGTELKLNIQKKHQKQYDYDYYLVQFNGADFRLNGMKEDIIARLADDLEHMKGEE